MAMWATVLPIDVAKTRIQTAYPGSAFDVGMMRQLRLLYLEGNRGNGGDVGGGVGLPTFVNVVQLSGRSVCTGPDA